MKTTFKSFLAVFLTFILLFTGMTFANADDLISEETTTQTQQTEETTDSEVTTEPVVPESGDDVVGKIYLCSRWSSITTTGHIWVYIHNTTDKIIRVGLLDVLPGEGVSLATFGFTRSDGMGIYYNMETYRNDKYCDDSCISVSDELTRDELEEITEKLLISNHWNPFYNCVFFACSIWNIGGDSFIMPFFYPPVTRLMISIAGGGEKCEMVHQPGENSYKQRGFGNGSYLENVCRKSLDAK